MEANMAISEILQDKPLVIFDLETTGTNTATDRIVQFAGQKISVIGQVEALNMLINPQGPIPTDASAVHGITDEDVADKPTFQEVATDIVQFIDDAHLGGFNVKRFDLPLLLEEFRRCGQPFPLDGREIVDVMEIFHHFEKRDLSAAVRFYLNEEFEDAHNAASDVDATARVFAAQLNRYAELPGSLAELPQYLNPNNVTSDGRITWNDNDEACLGFGKNAGATLQSLVANDRGYLEWILSKDFSQEVKRVIQEALEGSFPERQSS